MTEHTPKCLLKLAGPSGDPVDLSECNPKELHRWYNRAVYIGEFEGDFETFHELVRRGGVEIEHYAPHSQLMKAIGRVRSAQMAIGINAYEIAEIMVTECPLLQPEQPDQVRADLLAACEGVVVAFSDGRFKRSTVQTSVDDIFDICSAAIAQAKPKGETK